MNTLRDWPLVSSALLFAPSPEVSPWTSGRVRDFGYCAFRLGPSAEAMPAS